MAGKAKVVLTDYVWESLDVEKKTLEGLASLVALQTKSPAQFFPEAADCDALLNTYAGPITAEVMARMPRCKIIARYGIGVDTIDVDAATAAGIIVTNNPTYCIEEVAEHTLAVRLQYHSTKRPIQRVFNLLIAYRNSETQSGHVTLALRADNTDRRCHY